MTCTTADVITSTIRNFITNSLLSFAAQTLQKTVRVATVQNFNYTLSGTCGTGYYAQTILPSILYSPVEGENTKNQFFLDIRPLIRRLIFESNWNWKKEYRFVCLCYSTPNQRHHKWGHRICIFLCDRWQYWTPYCWLHQLWGFVYNNFVFFFQLRLTLDFLT